MKRPFERLISVHLVERRDDELDDVLGHFYWHWTYPTIEPTMRSLIEKRLYSRTVHSAAVDSFDFTKLISTWVYIQPASSGRHLFILTSTDFCPYTYAKLLVTFSAMFTTAKLSLARFLHYYLSLLISGEVTVTELATSSRLSLLKLESGDTATARRSHIKSIISLFHLDVILIYTGLLLKRKIAIYHHCQAKLLDFSTALSAFVAHRPESATHSVLYPNVDLHCTEQIDHLLRQPHFIATFQEAKVEERPDLYDIYVNLAAVEITISPRARDVFSMTKTHKEVAIALVRAAESDTTTSEDVIAEITKKTAELRQSLCQFSKANSLDDDQSPDCEVNSTKISKAKLKQKLLSPNLESFYWNLALAEGIAEEDIE